MKKRMSLKWRVQSERLVLQWGHSRHPAYLSADFGIDNHTDGFADEWIYAAEVGYSFQPALMLILRTRGSSRTGSLAPQPAFVAGWHTR